MLEQYLNSLVDKFSFDKSILRDITFNPINKSILKISTNIEAFFPNSFSSLKEMIIQKLKKSDLLASWNVNEISVAISRIQINDFLPVIVEPELISLDLPFLLTGNVEYPLNLSDVLLQMGITSLAKLCVRTFMFVDNIISIEAIQKENNRIAINYQYSDVNKFAIEEIYISRIFIIPDFCITSSSILVGFFIFLQDTTGKNRKLFVINQQLLDKILKEAGGN